MVWLSRLAVTSTLDSLPFVSVDLLEGLFGLLTASVTEARWMAEAEARHCKLVIGLSLTPGLLVLIDRVAHLPKIFAREDQLKMMHTLVWYASTEG